MIYITVIGIFTILSIILYVITRPCFCENVKATCLEEEIVLKALAYNRLHMHIYKTITPKDNYTSIVLHGNREICVDFNDERARVYNITPQQTFKSDYPKNWINLANPNSIRILGDAIKKIEYEFSRHG